MASKVFRRKTAGKKNARNKNVGNEKSADKNAGDKKNTADKIAGDKNNEDKNAGTGTGAHIPNFQEIIVNQQFIDNYYQDPPSSPLVAREIALLAKLNHDLRKEDLQFLAKLLKAPEAPLRDAAQIQLILPKILEATLVVSEDVRGVAVLVLKSIPDRLAEDHIEQILPFVRAGITHLAANVAGTSLDILTWLNRSHGDRLVSCKGGWVKTLKCFLVMLRWTAEARTGGWTFSRSSYQDNNFQGESLIKCLSVLASFLRTGLMRPRKNRVPMSELPDYPLSGLIGAILPTKAKGGYSCLDLFGSPLDNENCECPDVDTRKEALETFRPALEQGLSALSQDGGPLAEAAREAAEVLRKGLGNALGYEGYGSDENVGDASDALDPSDDEDIGTIGIQQDEAVEAGPVLQPAIPKVGAVESSTMDDDDGQGKTA